MIGIFKNYYDELKKYIIFLVVCIVVLSEYIELPKYIQTVSMLSLCLMILEILFEIRNIVCNKATNVTYGDFYDVSLELKKAILNELELKRKVKIRALGMSMGHAWQFLYNTLNPILADNNNTSVVNLEIIMLDINWTDLKNINPYWCEKLATNNKLIKQFLEINKEKIIRKRWIINLYYYSYVPNLHGVMINDNLLYLSRCSWKDGILQGGENSYERVNSDENVEENFKINHFTNWFEHVKNN